MGLRLWYTGGMQNEALMIEIENLHQKSLKQAEEFNVLYWQTAEADNSEVFAALDRYRDTRRTLKDLNGGESYKSHEAHQIMSRRPSCN